MSDSALEEIYQIIPHRPPFLFVDSIKEINENNIITLKDITGQEDFFKGHYPNRPIMPGVLLCECIFQAGAIFLAKTLNLDEEAKNLTPAVTRINNVKFKSPVKPGDQLEIYAELSERMNKVFYMKGYIKKKQKKVVSLDFSCTLIEGEF